MFNKMKRPYKKSKPNETIDKIKGIMKRLDMKAEESFSGNPYPEIYSMRLELPAELGGFGTNGKGRTEEYSIASGYAEFMERLQNNVFGTLSRTLMREVKHKHGFYYTPDEKYLSKKDVYALPNMVLDDMIMYKNSSKEKFIDEYYERLEKNDIEGVVSIPFYDTKNEKLIYIPFNMIMMSIGSNGMAAGNTFMEAVFQGFCELMERWGAAEVFYKQLTPPTVPKEFLKGFEKEYNIIKEIEKDGNYKVVVKDFSAGKGIPSLGVIIMDSQMKRYKLNVGSDTAFQSALSRCLTEIYQGIEDQDSFNKSLMDIPIEDEKYFNDDSWESRADRYAEFSSFTANGKGRYPTSLFKNEESYSFNGETFTCRDSYEAEVNYLIDKLHKMGYNVYIRDNSYLGFPSVMVYIPEISALGRKNHTVISSVDKFNMFELDKIEKSIFNFKEADVEELKNIDTILSKTDFGIPLENVFNVEMIGGRGSGRIDVKFFLSMLRYKLGDFKGAAQALGEFIQGGTPNDGYYNIALEYMQERGDEKSHGEIKAILKSRGHDGELVDEICSDLKERDKIFQYTNMPSCPKCEGCGLKSDCLSSGHMEICNRVYPVMKENLMNQMEIGRKILK